MTLRLRKSSSSDIMYNTCTTLRPRKSSSSDIMYNTCTTLRPRKSSSSDIMHNSSSVREVIIENIRFHSSSNLLISLK